MEHIYVMIRVPVDIGSHDTFTPKTDRAKKELEETKKLLEKCLVARNRHA